MVSVVYSHFFLLVSVLTWWARSYVLAQQLKMISMCLCVWSSDLAVSCAGAHSSDLYGKLVRGRTLRSFLT